MKIIELLYKEEKVFFYAIEEEENNFFFGTSKVTEPTMRSQEIEQYSLIEHKTVLFQTLTYEIEARMKSDKSLVKLYTFGKIKEEDRADFFHKLVEIATA